jgi:hypothetical protein
VAQTRGDLSPADIEDVLTEANLNRHLHDYDAFKAATPFISLACGAVERDTLVQRNFVYSARDAVLMLATVLALGTSFAPKMPETAYERDDPLLDAPLLIAEALRGEQSRAHNS